MKKLFKRSDDQAEMSFVEHLEALRWHIVRSVVAVLIGAIAIFANMDLVFDRIIMGPAHNDFITYKILCSLSHKIGLGDAMCMDDIKLQLISTQMSAQFMMSFAVAFSGGFVIAFPYVIWEFWRFVKPALSNNERRKTKGVIFWVSLLFFFGVAFGYFIITPYTINFFASFTLSDLITNNFTVSDYVGNITQLVLGTGIVFQLPLVVFFLSKVGILTPEFLRVNRKYAIVVILIVAAVITPPDVVSQLIVTGPLWLLYEISIGISGRVTRNLEKKEEEWS
ncbi:MAG TPA: twin-arginine translocase subunit TatC [Parasegetibacter sp.]